MKQSVNANEYFKFIKPVVLTVGKYLEQNRRNIHVIKSKRDKLDIQTNVDLGAEKIYFDAIRKKFPDHAIISEENQIRNESDFVWYIDPLDCTKEFFRGISIYNSSVTLEYKDKNILNIIYRPADNELYYSVNGKSYLNEKICSPSETKQLKQSIVYLYLPHMQNNNLKSQFTDDFKKIQLIAARAYRVRAMADENSAMCWVAAGKCDAFVDLYNPNAHWWDWSGGIHMVKNSGGIATNKLGKDVTKNSMHHGIIVANKYIHQELLDIIQNS